MFGERRKEMRSKRFLSKVLKFLKPLISGGGGNYTKCVDKVNSPKIDSSYDNSSLICDNSSPSYGDSIQ